MRLQPLGDSAYIIRDLGNIDAFSLSSSITKRQFKGIYECVPAYETVAVYVNPTLFDLVEFESDLDTVALTNEVATGQFIEIPVCYDRGIDLTSVSTQLGISPSEVIDLHSKPEYCCYAVGFSPGFPYLGYLDLRLSGLDRLASPRPRVPAGSVAITGKQTGIYPQETPGGWWIIGQTPVQMVDMSDAYFPIQAGDRVRFLPISEAEFKEREGTRI